VIGQVVFLHYISYFQVLVAWDYSLLNFIFTYLSLVKLLYYSISFPLYLICSCPYPYNLMVTTTYMCRCSILWIKYLVPSIIKGYRFLISRTISLLGGNYFFSIWIYLFASEEVRFGKLSFLLDLASEKRRSEDRLRFSICLTSVMLLTDLSVWITRANYYNLNQIRYLLCFSFFSCFPWWETRLTSNKIPFGIMSCNLSFIFDRPIICKTVIYVDQSDNSWCIHSALIPKYVVGSWLIGWNTEPWRVTQNHDVTHSYGMRLDLALHSITFFRFQGNQSLLLFLNTVGFAE
jgi:hypothetical protein